MDRVTLLAASGGWAAGALAMYAYLASAGLLRTRTEYYRARED